MIINPLRNFFVEINWCSISAYSLCKSIEAIWIHGEHYYLKLYVRTTRVQRDMNFRRMEGENSMETWGKYGSNLGTRCIAHILGVLWTIIYVFLSSRVEFVAYGTGKDKQCVVIGGCTAFSTFLSSRTLFTQSVYVGAKHSNGCVQQGSFRLPPIDIVLCRESRLGGYTTALVTGAKWITLLIEWAIFSSIFRPLGKWIFSFCTKCIHRIESFPFDEYKLNESHLERKR